MQIARACSVLRVLVVGALLSLVSGPGDAAVCRRPKGQLIDRSICRPNETTVDLGNITPVWTVLDATGREIGAVAGISNGTVHALATMQLPDGAGPEPVEIVLTPSALVTVPYESSALSRSPTCAEPLFTPMDDDRFATQLVPIRDSLGTASPGRVLYARASERIVASFYQVTVASAPTPDALDCGAHDAGHGPGQTLGGSVPAPCSNGFGGATGTTYPDGYSCLRCCQPIWKDGALLQQSAAPARDLSRLPDSSAFIGQAPFTLVRR